eukprot:CAMPEP_0117664260 /NCGR_PEP_ID=MMETSP0804-20121206/9114_1 /TAXON_ID=1074897 /ORGANISM="Tetraselmis astigmatica, Strain CCMP880" /LENGTH=258 /DNA_ID=CAMNT_0005471459 /DNA_START=237 /DNA_END=1013 /DNA_ORIENTATION=+
MTKSSVMRSAGVGAARPAVKCNSARPRVVAAAAADRKLWAPGVVVPEYLNGEMAGDYGWDPLGLGSDPKALEWYRQAELVHCRWAMLGVAGVLGQEILNPSVFFYDAPLHIPEGAPIQNMGGLLAWEFLLMHWVEVRRYQDIRKFGSVNEDPIFSGNKVPNDQMGYPGGIFDPLGFGKGDMKTMQVKEVKNGRLAMVAFMGFVIQAQATGKGPLACLADHLASPFSSNFSTNIGTCVTPDSVDVQGLTVPLTCLWPGQ